MGAGSNQCSCCISVTCTYSQFLAQKTPTCCVSLSSFYNDAIVPCPTSGCGCQGNSSQFVESDSPHIQSVVSGSGKNIIRPLFQCTCHMCPVRVHWHVKLNYKEYWRGKIIIANFNYRMNYSEWNLVVHHTNLDNLTQLFSFNYKSFDSLRSNKSVRSGIIDALVQRNFYFYITDWSY